MSMPWEKTSGQLGQHRGLLDFIDRRSRWWCSTWRAFSFAHWHFLGGSKKVIFMPLNSDEHLGAFDCDSDVMFEYNDIISTQKVAIQQGNSVLFQACIGLVHDCRRLQNTLDFF